MFYIWVLMEKDKVVQVWGFLREVLRGTRFVRVGEPEFVKDCEEFVLISVTINKESTKMILVVKPRGEPNTMLVSIQQLKGYIAKQQLLEGINRDKFYGIVGAPYISENSARICKENGMGCVDLAGNCFLKFNKVYIERTGYPNKNIEKRSLRSIFSPKASRILRVMLCNPKSTWIIQELSDEAKVSIGETFKVKKRLLELGYAVLENGKIKLNNPEQLLKKWSENYSFRKNTMNDYFTFGEPKEIEAKILRYCFEEKIKTDNKFTYAFTLFSGASLVAPYVRYSRVFMYVKDDIYPLVNKLEFKKVDSGANVTLLTPYDEGVFYGAEEINEMRVVSNIQLYLDLIGYKGRGEEAAEFLFKEKIKPQW